jgi:hypothetical protein
MQTEGISQESGDQKILDPTRDIRLTVAPTIYEFKNISNYTSQQVFEKTSLFSFF